MSMNTKTFHILIFGCQMNYSDSARIKAVLTNSWLEYVDTVEAADIVIFDTCSVRQKSEDKVTGKLQEIPQDKKIWITWCMIQHNFRHAKISKKLKDKKISGLMTMGNFIGNVATNKPHIVWFSNEEIKSDLTKLKALVGNMVYVNHAYNPMFVNFQETYPNIELFFRIDDTGFLPLMLEKLGYDVNPDPDVTNEYTWIIPHGTNQLMNKNSKTAYVPISTWCSQFCAFCIVPYARGLEKHLPVDQVLKEVEHHLESWIEEIVLLGQIVNKHPHFVEICKEILKMQWLKRLRYTSPYPTHYSDELLALHENEEKMCPHIHMPLQSGSDKVLKKMFRGYNAEQFREFVDKIRGLSRPISITTDIIVGFTDETEEDFQESLALTEYAKFDMVYIGIYSVRPGTYASRHYEDTVDKKVKHDRRERLNTLLKTISTQNNLVEHDTKRTIMVTSYDQWTIKWYTDNMKNITIDLSDSESSDFSDELVGKFLDVQVVASENFMLKGKLLW